MMADGRGLRKNTSDKSASKTNLAYELVRYRRLDPHGTSSETGWTPLIETNSTSFPAQKALPSHLKRTPFPPMRLRRLTARSALTFSKVLIIFSKTAPCRCNL